MRRRISSGLIPSVSASRLRCVSAANWTCGAPNPRKAPFGGVFVRVARAEMRTFGQRYGPPAWIAPRDRTTGVSVQYAPPSMTTSMSCAIEPAVAGHAGPMADDRRVALRRRRDVLVPVVDHPDRAARLEREQRGVEADDRRVLLLPAEPATGLGLDHASLRVVDREAPPQRGVDVVRALERAVDRDAAVVGRHRDHRVVLDVQLLLVTDPVLALEDEVGRGERRVGIAGGQLVGGEHVIRRLRVEDRGERAGPRVSGAARGAQSLAIGRGEERQRLGMVLDLAPDRDEDRLVRP